MPGPPEPHLRLSDNAPGFLATEHWGLLSARSLAWNEAFSRVAVFLNTLSASAVALALVADASGFDDRFKIFALVLFPIVLYLGLATYARIVRINLEDSYFVAAMNRLRRAYVDNAPEIRDFITSGVSVTMRRASGPRISLGDLKLLARGHNFSQPRRPSWRPSTR